MHVGEGVRGMVRHSIFKCGKLVTNFADDAPFNSQSLDAAVRENVFLTYSGHKELALKAHCAKLSSI